MNRKAVISFSFLIVFMIAIIAVLLFIGPKEIVEKIGIKNSYWIAFLVAVLGGVSTFTSTPFLVVIYTFSNGGANPLLLGIIAGTGLTISDSFFYYFGVKGHQSLPIKWQKKLEWLPKWVDNQSEWVTSLGVFLYVGFTPLPNDILTVGAALSKLKYKKFVVPLFLGNITFVVIFATLSKSGFSWLGF